MKVGDTVRHKNMTHSAVKKLLDNHPAQMRESLNSIKHWCGHGYVIQRAGQPYYHTESYSCQEMTYIVNLGDDLYKIGKTGNISQRLRAFQTSNPFVCGEESLVALIAMPQELTSGKHKRYYNCHGSGADIEKALHIWCIKREYNFDTLLGDNLKSKNQSEIFRIPIHALKELLDVVMNKGYVLLDRQIVSHLVNDRPGPKIIQNRRLVSESR